MKVCNVSNTRSRDNVALRNHNLNDAISCIQQRVCSDPSLEDLTFLVEKCRKHEDLNSTLRLYTYIQQKSGLASQKWLVNSLLSIINEISKKETLSVVLSGCSESLWNALIRGFATCGKPRLAINIYQQMLNKKQKKGKENNGDLCPCPHTFVALLQACAKLKDPETGELIHEHVTRIGLLEKDSFVGSSLIQMYVKCGLIQSAQEVFDSMQQRDIAGWNALFTGYTRQGESKLVLEIFDKMINEGIKPDDVTFLSILSACSHAGSVEKGRLYFDALGKEYGIEPTIKHYNCMVDLFGRAGQIKEALSMLRSMPFSPDLVVWTTLLASCRKWGNVEIGRQAFEAALRLDDKHMAAYNAMFNLYVDANMWEEAKQIESRKLNIQVGKGLG